MVEDHVGVLQVEYRHCNCFGVKMYHGLRTEGQRNGQKEGQRDGRKDSGVEE